MASDGVVEEVGLETAGRNPAQSSNAGVVLVGVVPYWFLLAHICNETHAKESELGVVNIIITIVIIIF